MLFFKLTALLSKKSVALPARKYSKKIMNKHTFQNYLFLSLLWICCGCENTLDGLSLRSDQNERFYWGNNAAASERVAKIMYNESNGSRSERFKIVHISDVHISSWSPSNHYVLPINLRQSVQFANQPELRINAMAVTGDFISYGKKSEAKAYMKSFASSLQQDNFIPYVICTGNHDSNIGAQEDRSPIMSTLFYKPEITNLLFTNNQNSYKRIPNENYYYKDFSNPQGGTIRMIALDMIDQPSDVYNTLNYAHYSQEQINWLSNVALREGMTSSHSVIILNHYPFQHHDSGASTYLCDGDYVHPWYMIPEIVEAFRGHTTLTKTYPNQFGGEDIHVDADFTNNTATFICYLGGHIHANAYFEIKGLSNEQMNLPKQKMIICTNQAPSEAGTVYNRVKREEDSLSSNSFCIHAIDTQEHKIYITFFGAFHPEGVTNYPDIQELTY